MKPEILNTSVLHRLRALDAVVTNHYDPDSMSDEDLERQLLDLHREAENIQATADGEHRRLTPSEDKAIERLFDRFRGLERTLDARNQPGQRKTTPEGPSIGSQRQPVLADGRPAAGRASSPRFVDVFGQAARDTGGWKSADDFLRHVHDGLSHPNLVNAAMSEGVGADGGFLAPAFWTSAVMDAALEMEVVRPRAQVYAMPSNVIHIAGVDMSDHSSNIGGLQGQWMAEGSTATAQAAAFKAITMRAAKLGVYCQSSNELLADGINFEQQLTDAMAKAISFDLDNAFIRGDGVNKPMGVLNSASLVTVAKESGQAADTIVFENVVNMWARLHPACHANAVWIVHPELVPQLFSMTFPGASPSTPGYLPLSGPLAGSPTQTLLGRPVIYSEKASTLGDLGDIILVDLSQYAIAMRLDMSLQRSADVGFMSDSSVWRLIIRTNGQALWNSAVTLRNGTNTLSWAVTLQARS
jgi:HK97 family phage major capsid protein